MKVLLFDIDGTLVRTNGAGKSAMEAALKQGFQVQEIKDVVPYSGRTDPAIGKDLLTVHDQIASKENVTRLTDTYLSELPKALDRFGGEVCLGIRPLLTELQKKQDDCLLGLLTGNVRAGAKIKLSFFDLWNTFHVGGFGDMHTDRDDVARAALSDARKRLPDLQPEQVWVIGDTPLDVSCARAIGANVIAVATGWHPLEELEACKPNYAVPDLNDLPKAMKMFGF